MVSPIGDNEEIPTYVGRSDAILSDDLEVRAESTSFDTTMTGICVDGALWLPDILVSLI